jgi:thioredoxin-related protein
MKEIKPKNEEDYHTIKELLEILKNHFAAYEILEEEEKFHVLQIIIKN